MNQTQQFCHKAKKLTPEKQPFLAFVPACRIAIWILCRILAVHTRSIVSQSYMSQLLEILKWVLHLHQGCSRLYVYWKACTKKLTNIKVRKVLPNFCWQDCVLSWILRNRTRQLFWRHNVAAATQPVTWWSYLSEFLGGATAVAPLYSQCLDYLGYITL